MQKDRLEVLEKIKQLELEGKFDQDVENDPPTRELKPGEVDFTRRKLTSKIKTKYAYYIARKFLKKSLKDRQLIIKEIKGLENFNALTSGAILTSNHFNAYESFALQVAYESTIHNHKRKFFRVIREGNYTSFPGFFGFLMRNCYTLPLSSNAKVTQEFLRSTDTILKKGHFVLVYPEQSMWWNYRKPKPLKKSSFKIASKAGVPVLPMFITMTDSDVLAPDGSFVQEYTINIGKAIYPNPELNDAANAEEMKKKNEEFCKEVYEDFYKIPLTYTTKK